MNDVKANIVKWNRQLDAKAAAANADWAECDAAEDLDFADWAFENAQLMMLRAVHARNHAHADKLAKAWLRSDWWESKPVRLTYRSRLRGLQRSATCSGSGGDPGKA